MKTILLLLFIGAFTQAACDRKDHSVPSGSFLNGHEFGNRDESGVFVHSTLEASVSASKLPALLKNTTLHKGMDKVVIPTVRSDRQVFLQITSEGRLLP